MKRLTREKRNQLIIVATITVAVLGVIFFGLIQPQYDSLSKIARAKKTADDKLAGIKRTITNANTTASDLTKMSSTLTEAEKDMASGDLYSWTYDTIRRFKQTYRVEIPDVGHPILGDMDLLPSFPYKQMRFTLNGTAYYHDLGRFIADFENNFPHSRVVNLVVVPSGSLDASNEKISFRIDVITLVKPNLS